MAVGVLQFSRASPRLSLRYVSTDGTGKSRASSSGVVDHFVAIRFDIRDPAAAERAAAVFRIKSNCVCVHRNVNGARAEDTGGEGELEALKTKNEKNPRKQASWGIFGSVSDRWK